VIHVTKKILAAALGESFITFARASIATRVNESGLIETLAANTPRIDYDPATLACKGLMIEEARSNLLLRSSELQNGAWAPGFGGTGSAAVITANDAVAPDGTMTAARIRLNRGAGNAVGDTSTLSQTNNAAGTVNGSTYVSSIYVKGNPGEQVAFRGVGASGYIVVVFDGTWQRLSSAEINLISPAAYLEIASRGTVTTNNDVTFWAWGGQCELGKHASSYIPTVAATVTRLADDASLESLVGIWNDSVGSMAAEFDLDVNYAGAANQEIASFQNGAQTHMVELLATNKGRAVVIVAGVVQVDLNNVGAILTTGAVHREALAFRAFDFSAVSDNSAPQTFAGYGALPVGITRLQLGNRGAQYLNGRIRRFRYWSRRLSDADLQALGLGRDITATPALDFDFTKTAVEVQTGSLKNPRIGYHTYTRDRTSANITVNSEAAAGPKDAPLRPSTYDYWLPTAVPATWVLDLGSAKPVNYIGIAAHTLGSSASDLFLSWSNDNITFIEYADQIFPTDDTPILALFPTRTARYVRIRVGTNPARIGVIHVGNILAMPRTIYGGHTPISLSRETVLTQTLSRGGAFLGQTYRRNGLRTSSSFKLLSAAWYRANFDPFVKEARKYPYFIGWRPSEFPAELAYGWTTDDIKPVNMGKRDYMQVSFETVGLGND
jgi:hypothetical protein